MAEILEPAEEWVLRAVPRRLYIGGEWVDSSSGDELDVQDPATGDPGGGR